MAELKVPNVFTIFPVGTTVGVYTVVVSDAGHPQPIGDAIESAVVAEDGSLTFTTLTLDGTKYYAAAKVSGEWRVMNLVTSEPTDADTSTALADHEADTTAVHGIADTSVLAVVTEVAEFEAVRRNLNAKTPTLTKLASNPIITFPTATFDSGQWPWIVNVVQDTGAVGATYGETYRIYHSTDHEEETAKIGLLTCADRAALLAGEWVDRGEIFKDEDGKQSETPAVIYDPVSELWFLYYHLNEHAEGTSNQTTLLATSADGIAEWTKKGIVLDTPADDEFGYPAQSGHGYFRPWRYGGKWYGHALLAGSILARFALWVSDDGENWAVDPRPLGFASHLTGDDKRIEWNSGTVIYWNGQLWWIGLVSDFSSGGVERETEYVAAPISDDFRKLTAPPISLFPTLQEWEKSPADNRSGGSVLVDTDGALILAYSGSETDFGIARGA